MAGWLANVPVLRAVITDAGRGLDAMDESHYLMAAQPWAQAKAFNGVFGWYSGPLLRLVGDDLGALRVLGAVVLAGSALVLAGAVRRFSELVSGRSWPAWLSGAWPPASVAAAMCYYTVFVRTPSYNWFAAIGLMVLATGLLSVIGRQIGSGVAGGALVAAGLFLTAIGKGTTALGGLAVTALVALALLVRRRLPWPCVAAAVATGLALAAAHLVLVAPLGETVSTYRRASGMLAVVDPGHYAPDAVGRTVRLGLRNVLIDRPWPYLGLLLLPVVIAVVVVVIRRVGLGSALPRPGLWLAAAFAVTWSLVLLRVLTAYPGGVPGLGMSAPAGTLAAEAGLVVAVVVWGWQRTGIARFGTVPGDGSPPRHRRPVQRGHGAAVLACAALLALGAGYPLGTNVEYATQLHGAFPVLVAAAVVGVSAVPDRGAQLATAVLVVGAVLLGAVLVPTTREVAPYRIAPLAQQTVARSVTAGSPPLLLDRETVAWIDGLRALGEQGGFQSGTPMLDLTWHPASVLVLNGRAPSVLLPAFPGWPDPGGAAAYALGQEDPVQWRAAWLLVPSGQDHAITASATAVLDRRFPDDYDLVGTVVAPYDRQMQGLWRPRRPGGGAGP